MLSRSQRPCRPAQPRPDPATFVRFPIRGQKCELKKYKHASDVELKERFAVFHHIVLHYEWASAQPDPKMAGLARINWQGADMMHHLTRQYYTLICCNAMSRLVSPSKMPSMKEVLCECKCLQCSSCSSASRTVYKSLVPLALARGAGVCQSCQWPMANLYSWPHRLSPEGRFRPGCVCEFPSATNTSMVLGFRPRDGACCPRVVLFLRLIYRWTYSTGGSRNMRGRERERER